MYTTDFSSGKTSQRVGGLSLRSGDFGVRYENDYFWNDTKSFGPVGNLMSDSGDRFRTAAFQLTYKNLSAGIKLYTGDPALDGGRDSVISEGGKYGTYGGSNANKYRMGAAYVGINGYTIGRNSEEIRHAIQNRLIHDKSFVASPWFEKLDSAPSNYFQYQSYNPYSLW